MKIKISKSQWDLLKCSQLEQLPPDEIKFFKKLPEYMQKDILNEIKIKSPPVSEIRKFLQYLKQTEQQIMDRTPAPTIEKINQMIEQVKMINPQDPLLQHLENLQQITIDLDKMVSQEDKEGVQNAINSILDAFKQGKMNKKQLEESLREFSKRNNNMKIKLSKAQWEAAGTQAGWIKISQNADPKLQERRIDESQKIWDGFDSHANGNLPTDFTELKVDDKGWQINGDNYSLHMSWKSKDGNGKADVTFNVNFIPNSIQVKDYYERINKISFA